MNYETLGQRLRMAREHARFSQTEAAQALSVTPAALNQYESGKRRVEALTIDQLSRLYGVPVGYFFGQETPREDWEEALRLKAEEVCADSKAGIARLVESVRDLEDLYQRTETPLPGIPHPPFASLPESPFSSEEVAEWAEKARRHYDLGMAPLTNLRGFLEAQGQKVFVVSFGTGDGCLSGLSFQHPRLGSMVAINGDQAYTRWPYTLAHEFAHRLYHYDRPAILSRTADARPLEEFAESFASHFLVPDEALHERLRELGIRVVSRPEQVVHLARYFAVSYRAMRHKLEQTRRLLTSSEITQAQPVLLAQALGYPVRPAELGQRPLPPEERLPRVFLELSYRAVVENRLSKRRVAEMLGISDIELEERLNPEQTGPVDEDA